MNHLIEQDGLASLACWLVAPELGARSAVLVRSRALFGWPLVGQFILGRRDLGSDATQAACRLRSGRAWIPGRRAGWPGLAACWPLRDWLTARRLSCACICSPLAARARDILGRRDLGVYAAQEAWMLAGNPVERGSPMIEQDGRNALAQGSDAGGLCRY